MEKARIGLARKTARKLLKELKINSPPIDLVPIIKHLGFNVVPKRLKNGLSGVQITISGECFILYNETQHVHRNRFTVAHEIGHSLLGHTGQQSGFLDLHSEDIKEIEANQFAAELLMPLEMMKRDLKTLSTAKDLAQRYWVSMSATNWRLMETGFYKKLISWE